MAETRNLSDILGSIYVRSAQWTRVELTGAVGLQVPRGKQIAVHFILEGAPLMHAKSRTNFPLRPGDAMIVLDGQSHVLKNREVSTIQPLKPASSRWFFGDAANLHLKEDDASASSVRSVILTALLRVRWPFELAQWQLLPPVLHGNRNFGSDAARDESAAIFDRLSSRPGGPLCITRYAEFLLVRELQQVLERSPGLLRASENNDIRIEQALAAIAQDPAVPWSVDTLARHVGMARSTFAERFSEYVHVTPMALVFQHRMELAAQHLRHRALPIKEIARLIGYGSVASFTRAFSAHFGDSPAAYRRRELGDAEI